jgi:hypothetical protein
LTRLACRLRPWLAVAIALGALPASAPVAQTTDAARYKTYDEMTAALRGLAQTNANLVKPVDLGKSHDGRSVCCRNCQPRGKSSGRAAGAARDR